MKLFSKFMVSLSIATLATVAYAQQFPTVADCPPLDMVSAQAKFTQATPSDSFPGTWMLTSPAFSFKDKQWNMLFSLKLEGVGSPSEALIAGQKYLNEKITFTEPYLQAQSQYLLCVYTFSLDYLVAAVTPPVQYTQQSHLMRLKG